VFCARSLFVSGGSSSSVGGALSSVDGPLSRHHSRGVGVRCLSFIEGGAGRPSSSFEGGGRLLSVVS
jgi:hypothetical protein